MYKTLARRTSSPTINSSTTLPYSVKITERIQNNQNFTIAAEDSTFTHLQGIINHGFVMVVPDRIISVVKLMDLEGNKKSEVKVRSIIQELSSTYYTDANNQTKIIVAVSYEDVDFGHEVAIFGMPEATQNQNEFAKGKYFSSVFEVKKIEIRVVGNKIVLAYENSKKETFLVYNPIEDIATLSDKELTDPTSKINVSNNTTRMQNTGIPF